MTIFKRELITTSDGSSSIYIPDMDEQYHSIHGAINESNHVFIKNAFDFHESKELSIFEVGFGTGLNAFLTFFHNIKKNKIVEYDSIERYPLTAIEYKSLNYPELIDKDLMDSFIKMHKCEAGNEVCISDVFKFKRIEADLKEYNLTKKYDIIYFDAFAPNKQSDMWTRDIFQRIYDNCNYGAVFTTYCAKGEVRRLLLSVGFEVKRLPGPPRKHEMLRAIKH